MRKGFQQSGFAHLPRADDDDGTAFADLAGNGLEEFSFKHFQIVTRKK